MLVLFFFLLLGEHGVGMSDSDSNETTIEMRVLRVVGTATMFCMPKVPARDLVLTRRLIQDLMAS